MNPVQPNPYSPYATADPMARHLFPTLFAPPEPGTLAPTSCFGLAAVGEHPIELDPAAKELPPGLCTACVASMRGTGIPDSRPTTICRNCGDQTHHNQLCAVCRADAHQLWADTRVAAAPAPSTGTGPFVVLGGPINTTAGAFCEHGDLAITARMYGYRLTGDQTEESIDLLLPRCYLAKVFGAVLAVVDHDPSHGAQDRFTATVDHAQELARRTLQERAARDENGHDQP